MVEVDVDVIAVQLPSQARRQVPFGRPMKGFYTWYVCMYGLVSALGGLKGQVYDCRRDRVESSPIRSLMSNVEVFRIAVFSKPGPGSLPDYGV